MSMLTDQKIIVHSSTSSWRFEININKFEILKSEQFAKALQKQFTVYVFVVADVTTTFENESKSSELFEDYLYLKKMFDNELARMLSEQDYENHAIDLIKNKKSSYMSLYNLSQIELTKLRRYLNDALIKKWIKFSISLASVSIFFVFKKDEELRLYVNYKDLNAIIIKNRHSLSFIIETLNRLCDVKRFTKLNLKDAYYRIQIKRGDEWKTAFRTRYDHFEYQIMPFELTNAPTIFQIYINKTLRKLINVICVIYLNDILIFNENSTKHRLHVQRVLKRLKNYELYINLKKCEFDIDEIDFLNFIISTKEIRMNSKRIQMIKKWFKSKTYREMQIFLKFVNFYKRFIYHYSKIAAPLTSLLKDNENEKKKNSFEWSKSVEQAFRQLCDIFMSTSLFIHYNLFKKIRMKTDVFNFAIASILSQQNENKNWRSMTFWSRKIIFAKQNYEIYDQKLLTIIVAFKQWKHYLKNSFYSIKVLSDHNNFKKLMTKKKLNSKQTRWTQILIVYNFKIFHHSNAKNSTNEPSRRPDYEKISLLNTKLLLTLQNKLTLSSNKESLTQSERKNLIKLTLVLQLTKMSINIDVKLVKLTRNKRKILTKLASMFKLTDIQIIIFRKIINDILDDSYEKSLKSMKFLIKKLQARNQWMKTFHVKKSAPSRRLRKRFKKWTIDDKNFIKCNDYLYVSNDAAVRKKLIKKHHDNSLSEHFKIQKILNLIQRKYHWVVCAKQIKAYVKTYNVCQRIKISRHKSYKKLNSLFISEVS